MQLTKSSEFNTNYAAKIVEISDFTQHPNPKCERLKCCVIDGYSIAVGIDTNPGTYIYFPIECAISETFLSANNLFRDKTKNKKQDESGFFEDNRRVKIIRLQGYPSEGFIMPIESMYTWLDSLGNSHEIISNLTKGTEFDKVGDHVICQKYIPKDHKMPGQPGNGGKITKKLRGISKVIENQFRFHYDTTLIKKCPNVIHPNDIISITAKVHGTSGISAYVLCQKNIIMASKVANWICNWIINPILRVLCMGNNASEIQKEGYDFLWSSRSVVKNQYYNEEVTKDFYGVDIWTIANDVILKHLNKGLTVYYEIIGYLPNGGAIQSLGGKAYDYGFEQPGVKDLYTYGKHYGIQIYRLTYTNPDGFVYEFSAKQVQQWCKKHGLIPVEEYYYGYAKDLYPDLNISEHWNENFMQRLESDTNFNMECLSPTCKNQVPHEGIVIKIENSLSEAYKLKCIKFLEKESKALDVGSIDIETES